VKTSARSLTRAVVSIAAVVGISALVLGPLIAPFAVNALGGSSSAEGADGQNFTAIDGAGVKVERDAWGIKSGFLASTDVGAAQEYARTQLQDAGAGEGEFQCLVDLWTRESRWNHRALNKSSGAYGIPQSLPGKKMASAGADWETNPETQIDWGLGYIKQRYKTPCRAWKHSEDNGWY
jgi:hypothetical protein